LFTAGVVNIWFQVPFHLIMVWSNECISLLSYAKCSKLMLLFRNFYLQGFSELNSWFG
jgi:hypothetical protein